MKNKLILLFCILIFTSYNVNCQQMTTKGKDFWLGFMKNISVGNLSVYLSSNQATTGVVNIPGSSWSQNFSVTSNSTTQVIIPNSNMIFSNGIIENKGIHITTMDTVSVFALNYGPYTSDATVVFPTNSLGNEYRILSNIGGALSKEEFLIVATDNNTEIQITPIAGTSYIINLNQGQTYQVLSDSVSGTKIKTTSPNKKIAVFTGNVCALIGDCQACDHLFEQITPINCFGKNFVTVPLLNKIKDYFRIVAHYNNTSITINNGIPIILNEGQYHQFSSNQTQFIESTLPVFIYQFAQGYYCDSVGDPFMLIVPPLEQSIDDITFNAFTSSIINSYFVNIVTETAHINSLTLDGSNITFTTVPNNPQYSYVQLSITQGNHRVISPFGFIASVYGFGHVESYGYSTGFSMKNLLTNFEISSLCDTDLIVSFLADTNINITNYQWFFGDGTTVNTTTPNINHTYPSNGTFTVGLLCSGNNIISDTIWKTFTLANQVSNIINPVICQGENFTVGIHNYTVTGNYYDTLTTFLGCDSIVTTNLIVGQIEQALLSPIICQGENFTVGTHNYTTTGNYTDTLTTYLGCDSIVTTNLTVTLFPIVDLGIDGKICEGDVFELSVNVGYASYLWQDSSINNSYTVTKPGKYWITVSNDDCNKSDTINFIVCPEEINIWIPSAFTPNNDGNNDVFQIIPTEGIANIQGSIYNRWGEVIYLWEGFSKEKFWNGKVKNQDASQGVYYYLIIYKDINGKQYEKKGSVTLIR